MKKNIGLTLTVVGIMLAIPTYAVDNNTSYLNTVVSKTTSAYQTNSFEEIGIAGIAADQDGLKLLTLKRYRATGQLITIETQTCNRQKSCALTAVFAPSNNEAGQTINFILTAQDIYGNETTVNRNITVGNIPQVRDGLDHLTISSTNSRTITIPRDGRSVNVEFSTTVYDNTGIKSVTLNRTNPIVGGFPYNVTWPSNFNTARGETCKKTSPCTQRASITFTSADVGRTIQVFASASPLNDDFGVSDTLSFRVVQEASTDTTAPTGSITATPSSFTLGSSETGTVQLRASVQDNVTIQSVRFYRTNPQNNAAESVSVLLNTASTGTECNTSKTNCTFSANTLIPGIFAGLNTPYYAIIKDAAGNETRTASVNVRVNARTTTATTSTTSVPTVTISPTTITMDPSATRTLTATASSTGGVYAIELRAQPSWTDTVIKKRCTLNSSPRSGSCTMDIGPFTGRSSGTIRYWAIAWDATSGMGGNSGEKTATITTR